MMLQKIVWWMSVASLCLVCGVVTAEETMRELMDVVEGDMAGLIEKIDEKVYQEDERDEISQLEDFSLTWLVERLYERLDDEGGLDDAIEEKMYGWLAVLDERSLRLVASVSYLPFDVEDILLRYGSEDAKAFVYERMDDDVYPMLGRLVNYAEEEFDREVFRADSVEGEDGLGLYFVTRRDVSERYKRFREKLFAHQDESLKVKVSGEFKGEGKTREFNVKVEVVNEGDEVVLINRVHRNFEMHLFFEDMNGELMLQKRSYGIGCSFIPGFEWVGQGETIAYERRYHVSDGKLREMLATDMFAPWQYLVQRKQYRVYAVVRQFGLKRLSHLKLDVPGKYEGKGLEDAWIGWAVSEPVVVKWDGGDDVDAD
ncbi:hypothetical protein JD969_13665 [Planctomycetota bacterium]|nr:hypothetical protein JD969_13665 [Planctomycetota bacterium]